MVSAPVAAFAQQADPTVAAPATAPPSQPVPVPATSQAEPAGQREGQGEDIIVTAQRRDESLSRTPVSVQVIDAGALADAQVRGQEDLRTLAPGLSIRSGVNSNELNFAVRGQSRDPLSEGEPGALPYVNEVPVGGGKVSSALYYDLQSIQVLKGPQGTLFGRSATGGAVLITTQRPKNEFGGYISGSVGNYDLFGAEGAINVPLIDEKVLLRVAGIYREHDGYQRNIFPNLPSSVGDTDQWGIRPSLTVNLSDSFSNEFVLDYSETTGTPLGPVISGLVPFTGVGAPFVPVTFLYAGTAPAARATALAFLGAFLPGVSPAIIAGYYDAYFAPGTGHTQGGLTQELANQQARGPFVINSDGIRSFKADVLLATNITTLEISPSVKLKNVFGYIDTFTRSAENSDGTPFGLGNHYIQRLNGMVVDGATNEWYRAFSEELQLQGTIIDGRLEYTTGVYYSDEDRRFLNIQPFFDILLGGVTQTNSYTLSSQTYAGYGQGTYALTDDGLSVTLGARYTVDKRGKRLLPDDSFAVVNPTAPPGFDYDQSATFKTASWQLGLDYQITPSTLIYGVTRRAWKAGGFNGTVAPRVGGAEIGGDSFTKEKVTDVELGLKFQGNLGNMPTRIAIAGFNYWVEDSQRLAFTLVNGNPSSLTVNVPKAKLTGFEFQGQFSPAPWLSIGGVYNYINARYGNEQVVVNADPQIYDQVPDTPEHSGSVFADATIPVMGDLALVLHGDVYAQSSTTISPRSFTNPFGVVIDSYEIANFRLGIQNEEAGWSLMANLQNAFDKTYYTGGLPTGEIFQINILNPGPPRTYSINARFNF